ncbi:MAG: hypothetical protein ACP5E3_07500 [Bacteroidales bacterium]
MELIKKLKNIKSKDLDKKVFVGFDGFDDKIQKVVKSEKDGEVVYYPTIEEYAKAVQRAAGRSSQFQIRTQVQKLGGNAPIMANSLGSMGLKNSLMASLGYPEIRPVFKDLHPLVSPVSVCDPGETNALEFNDGKVMLSEMTSFNELNWCSLLINPGHERILEEMNSSDLIALVDWANLVHCSDIWEGIYKDILPALKEPKKFFFDIADPSRSSKEELKEVIEIIALYSSYGKVYLGINENETFILYEKIFEKSSADISLEEAGTKIYNLLNIDGLLIHPIDRSLMISSQGIIEEKGRVVAEPKISTGGGDNFNAGFCLGLLMGFTPQESMITGMATSGFYVKYGKSPLVNEIAGYLEE